MKLTNDTKLLIDELGGINKQLPKLLQLQERAKQIKVVLREEAENQGITELDSILLEGIAHTAIVGAKGNERTADMQMVFEQLGQETFIAHATITLESLDKLLTPDQRRDSITSERTGTRPVKTVQRLVPAEKAAARPKKKAA